MATTPTTEIVYAETVIKSAMPKLFIKVRYMVVAMSLNPAAP